MNRFTLFIHYTRSRTDIEFDWKINIPLPWQITESGAGYIDKAEVQAALKICGLDVPGFQVR